MKNIIKKILRSKKIVLGIVIIGIVFLLWANDSYAMAQSSSYTEALKTSGSLVSNSIGVAVALILSTIALIVTTVLGLITTLLIQILVNVANFNNIINVETVKIGWVAVRDLCNMFFILILLVIAFATILRVESYSLKKTLPKLLIMAVLINFSKTIFGLIIDFSQVIMLTFTNAFANGHGWFINMFKVQDLLSTGGALKSQITSENPLTAWSTSVAIIAGVIASIITLVVIAVMLAILVFRVAMLWVYTILSPLVFLAFAFPPLQKYVGKIWEDFVKQVMIGPILAFFIWLALTTAETSSGEIHNGKEGLCAGVNTFFCDTNFQRYLITIALLIGGLMVAQQIGGAAGSIAGKGMTLAKGAMKLGYKAPLVGADWAQRKLSRSKTAQKWGLGGIDLSPVRTFKRIKEGLERGKAKDLRDMQAKAGVSMGKGGIRGIMAATGSDDFTKEVLRGPFGLSGLYRTFKAGWGKSEEDLRKESGREEAKAKLAQAFMGGDIKEKGEAFKNLKDLYDKDNQVEPNKYLASLPGKKDIKKEAEDRINNAEELKQRATKKIVFSPESDKAFLSAVQEAKSSILTTDEDVIARGFMAAIQRGDKELAAGHYLRSSEVGGLNTLLTHMGYSWIDAGFTAEQEKNLLSTKGKSQDQIGRDKDYYERRQGVNDMFRNLMIDKLGMDDQKAFTVQGEGAAINFQNGHLYGAKTTGFRDGKIVQKSADDQTKAIITDARKGDIETFVRRQQKSGYGGQDTKGKWTTSRVGQEMMIRGWKKIGDEIGRNRWNQSAAEEVGREEEIKVLKDILLKIGGKDELKNIFGTAKIADEHVDILDYLDKVGEYSKQSGDEIGKHIIDKIKQSAVR